MHYLLLSLYAIPWAFLGLYGDVALHTIWLYLPALLAPIGIGWFSGKHGNVPLALTGNLFTAVSSFAFTLLLRTDRWNSYCKPFGSIGMLLILWLIPLLVQTLLWRHYRKDKLTGAILWILVVLILTWPSLCQFLALI